MTELLYLRDSYLKGFDAEVAAISENRAELDKTAFYVQGGGQPSDIGTLRNPAGKEFRVLEVLKREGRVWHKLESAEGLAVGEKVHGTIDWARRYWFMRMHSSAHVLAGVIFKETGKMITGNQLGNPESRMDFNTEDYSPEFFKSLEEKANQVIARNLGQTVSFLPRGEALKIPELFRLKDVLPKEIREFRIATIEGFDTQADGGTLTANTREIGKVKILRTENKGAQNRRFYWTLE